MHENWSKSKLQNQVALFIFVDGVVDVITAVAVVVVDYLSESDKNPIFSAESALQNERRQQQQRQQQQ